MATQIGPSIYPSTSVSQPVSNDDVHCLSTLFDSRQQRSHHKVKSFWTNKWLNLCKDTASQFQASMRCVCVCVCGFGHVFAQRRIFNLGLKRIYQATLICWTRTAYWPYSYHKPASVRIYINRLRTREGIKTCHFSHPWVTELETRADRKISKLGKNHKFSDLKPGHWF